MPTAEVTFADWLRGQLEDRGWGIRTLARKMNPENPEVPRRALNHYMRGSRPDDKNAALIAQALGVDRDSLPIEEAARSGGPFPRSDHGRADEPRGGSRRRKDQGEGLAA